MIDGVLVVFESEELNKLNEDLNCLLDILGLLVEVRDGSLLEKLDFNNSNIYFIICDIFLSEISEDVENFNNICELFGIF